MFRLDHTILIEESPKVVWGFLANLPVSLTCHRRRCRFQWIGNPRPGEGSHYMLELSLLGLALRQEGRVTRWDSPHGMAMAQWCPQFPRRGFTHQQRFNVHLVQGRPQAAVLQSTVVGGLGPWLVEVVFKEIVRRSMLEHLEALKRAIESTDKSGRPLRDPAGRLAEMPVMGAG